MNIGVMLGDYDSYIETHRDVFVDSNKYYLLNIGGKGWYMVWKKNTLIERGAEINPPVFIGDNTIVKSGANIESYTVIGNNCTIGGENTSIKKSIIWDNVKIDQ